MSDLEKILFLKRYISCTLEIERLCEELDMWKSAAVRMGAKPGIGGGGSTRTDILQRGVENTLELQDELGVYLDSLVRLRHEIDGAIKSVSDDRLRLLLKYRYIDGLSWSVIADRFTLDVRWVHRLHDRAISKLTIESHPFRVL